ncbi:MAG: DUF2281 domain-containing protein [Nitrospinae bacterium]|nr:DUF2281 domain-containing protein [Nitrospinota bacterium]MBI3813225.1 DUF2281 domain-containing protein [Nitrospinota bacterium]
MQTDAFKITDIYKELSLLPNDKLNEVRDFIEFVLSRQQTQKRKVVKLRGIWSNKGFEKIGNLEKELKTIQKEFTESFFKRNI